MSFILDALKKADAERHVGELPGLRSAPAMPASMTARRGGWQRPALLVGGVLSLAAGLVYTAPWKKGPSVSLPERTPATSPDPRASVTSSTSVPGADPIVAQQNAAGSVIVVPATTVSVTALPASAVPPMAAPSTAPRVATEVPAPPALPMTPRPVHIIKPTMPTGSAPSGKVAAATDAAPSPKPAGIARTAPPPTLVVASAEPVNAMTLAQLPPTIRAELPALSVGGSMYSGNPADRMLLIDKRMLHEGDEIAPGLLLEMIQPKSAILRYKGFVFRLPL